MGKKQDNILKARAWTFIIYPESTDISQFEEKIKDLSRLGIAALYALHDKDTIKRSDTEEPKKAHYHVILIWEGPTTQSNALETAKGIVSTVNYIEPIRSLVGASRYLCHLDDADKYQYDKSIVRTVGNVDYSELIESSKNDRIEVRAMAQYIAKNNITHFDVFVFYCMENNLEWFRIISERNTFFFKNLIQSQHFKNQEKIKSMNLSSCIKKVGNTLVDIRTGEVIAIDEKEKEEL